MGRNATGGSFLDTVLGKVRRRSEPAGPVLLNTPLAMLERLHAGEHPDYCLYLRPPAGGPVAARGPLSVDLEEMLARGFAPLPMITLDETNAVQGATPLPDEAFLALANHARVLALAPNDGTKFLSRLALIKSLGPLGRCICVMPDAGTLGTADWPTDWPRARAAAAEMGIEFSAYTPGGWLFRLDREGKAVTFRPIVNPNPEKIARALEGICQEME